MVGSYYDASGTVHSFVYNYGASIDTQFPSASALPAVIDPVTIDAGSGGDTYITGVNAKGVITGYFTSHGLRGSYGFIGTPVP